MRHEPSRNLRRRRLKDLPSCSRLGDAAGIEDGDGVAYRCGRVQIVGDDQDGYAELFTNAAQCVQYRGSRLGIEGGGSSSASRTRGLEANARAKATRCR